MKKIIFILLFLTYSLSSFSSTTWSVNNDHSEILFSLKYLKLAELTGKFKKIRGEVEIDSKNAPTKIFIQIEASSIDTGNNIRDGHLKGSEFFDSKTFPLITYESNKIIKIHDGTFKSSGMLKIKEASHPIEVIFKLTEEIKDTWNYATRFVSFKSSLKKSDFNINWNKTLPNDNFLIGDDINVNGTLQLQPTNHLTPGVKHKIPDTKYIREREKLNRGEIESTKTEIQIRKSEISHPNQKIEIAPSKENEYQINEKSLTWWISLFFIGLIGFISSIIISFYLKDKLTQNEHFKENGIKALYIDLLNILILVLFSVSFWIIGWSS